MPSGTLAVRVALCASHNSQNITEDINIANRNFANSRMYTGHVMPVLLDCNFVVDAANGNGLGIRSLKGPYIQNVFMHTSSTPANGNSNPSSPGIAVLNPNPASGTIIVQLQDNFSRSYSGCNSIVSPVSGSALKIDNSALTAGVAYIITTLGNATSAKWHLIGVPAGVTPAVGVSFIAASDGGAGNTLTSRVMATAAAGSGVASIETVGDPNLSIAPNPGSSQGFAAQIILQCRDYAGALVAPADGSVISLQLLLSNSSVLIAGE